MAKRIEIIKNRKMKKTKILMEFMKHKVWSCEKVKGRT